LRPKTPFLGKEPGRQKVFAVLRKSTALKTLPGQKGSHYKIKSGVEPPLED